MISFNRNKLIIISVGIAIAGFILCFVLYMPLVRQLRLKSNDAKTLEAELFKARDTVAYMQTVASRQQLVNEENLFVATDELIKRGGLYHINFVSTRLEEPRREAVYVMLPIYIVLESGYSELGDFLGSLDNLEKSVIKVDEFDLAPSTSEPSKLRAKLTLDMYVLR
ncbi:MAG: type 4a pilus biogenesis protein PilO [Candidatus Omnitrophota bacterium]|jgi:Tfp pilus assembly protein PilO